MVKLSQCMDIYSIAKTMAEANGDIYRELPVDASDLYLRQNTFIREGKAKGSLTRSQYLRMATAVLKQIKLVEDEWS